MRRTGLFCCCLLLFAVLTACGGPPAPQFSWREPLTAATALPQKVAVFVDAAYVRRTPEYQRYTIIEDSIALGQWVSAEMEVQLARADMEAAASRKFFIGTYRLGAQSVTNAQGYDLVTKPAPLHVDPTVCRNAKSTDTMLRLWQAAAESFGPRSAVIPVELSRSIGTRFQADTLAFVFAVMRKDDDAAETTKPLDIQAGLAGYAASFVGVVLVRAIDGAIVYQSAVSIPGPQRESTARSAVKAACNGLPHRERRTAYPIPPVISVAPDDQTGAPEGSPWLEPPPPPPGQPAGTPRVNPSGGVRGRLVGSETVAVLRRPMALGDPIATVPSGTEVRVLQRDLHWFLIVLPNGQSGWVFQRFVELD